jgi:hypothetical protein
VRERIIAAIERIARAEAVASAAPKEPDFELVDSFPVLVNDEAAVARTRPCWAGSRRWSTRAS